MQSLEKRWDSRKAGLEPLTVTASSVINSPVAGVWTFLTDPRSAILTNPDVIRAFHVPGTPVGAVGEQHCIVMTAGGRVSAHISEVVALEAPYRLVTRWPTFPTEALSILTLAPGDGRTVLTYQLGTRIERGATKRTEPTVRADMQDQLKRIRVCVESGAGFPEV